MKALILTTTLFSFSLLSCPDLGGSYQCTQLGDNYEMVIVQNDNDFSITNHQSTKKLIADQTAYPYSDGYLNGAIVARCDSEKLAFIITGDNEEEDAWGNTYSMLLQGLFEKSTSGVDVTLELTASNHPGHPFITKAFCQKI